MRSAWGTHLAAHPGCSVAGPAQAARAAERTPLRPRPPTWRRKTPLHATSVVDQVAGGLGKWKASMVCFILQAAVA